MKVFMSWSGTRSHVVAKVFAEWLPTVLYGSEPWISSVDIDKGATWITSIKDALQSSQGVGVFFATHEALASPWLNFEAGAIASLGAQRVCVVCVDIEPSDMSPPLSLFQGTRLERDDIFKLIKSLNAQQERPSPDGVLVTIFSRAWGDLESEVQRAIAGTEGAAKKPKHRSTADQALQDIASGVQRIESRLGILERAVFPREVEDSTTSSNVLSKLISNVGVKGVDPALRRTIFEALLSQPLSKPELNRIRAELDSTSQVRASMVDAVKKGFGSDES
jgi:hypothetical protein